MVNWQEARKKILSDPKVQKEYDKLIKKENNKMNNVYYECPYCHDCFTAKDWNEHNRLAILTFGYKPLPESLEDSDGAYDCPSCEERVDCIDLNEI